MKRPHSIQRQSGMALLEALISILVFSLGVLGIVALQAKASQFSVDAEDRTRAALLASELVSQMWAQSSTTLSSSTLTAWQSRVTDSSSGLLNATGTSSVDSAGLATIKISWKAPWRKSAEQANNYITQVLIP
jgi:type IV pilus assembly protein PilV